MEKIKKVTKIDVITCPHCKGETVIQEEYEGGMVLDEMCPTCDGEGVVWLEEPLKSPS